MLKKILAVFLLLLVALSITGGAFEDIQQILQNDLASTPVKLGTLTGILLPLVTMTLSAIFLMVFDGIYKKSYIDGFKARKRQNTIALLFAILYFLMFWGACFAAAYSNADNYLVALAIMALPYFVPFMIFAGVYGVYATPYNACRKQCKLDDAALNTYLSDPAAFWACTENGSVLASDAAIFFPKAFCLIPFSQIASIKFYNVLEKNIIFTLTNGKKITLVANKKQYEAVEAAIAAKMQ